MDFDKSKSFASFNKCLEDNQNQINSNLNVRICATERFTPIGSRCFKYTGNVKFTKNKKNGVLKITVLKALLFTDEFKTDEQEFLYIEKEHKLRINFNFNTIEPFSRVLIEVYF